MTAFLANALLTRALGLSLKGEYTWILNYANIISIISGLGIYQSIPFFIRNRPENDWLQEYINIFTLQAAIYFCISLIIGWIFRQNFSVLFIGLLSAADIFSQQLNMLLLIDKITERNRIYTLGAFVNFFLSVLILLLLRNNLYAAVFCAFTVKLFYIISYLILSEKKPHPLQTSGKKIAEKVQFGYLAMFSFLLIVMNYKIDVIMLKSSSIVSAEQLSLYTTGVSIAEIAWMIPDVFKEVLFSRTSNKSNDYEVAAALRLSNFVVCAAIIAIILFGRIFIRLFFGIDFVPAYRVTILLFLGIPAMSWFKIIYMLFNAQGRRKTSFFVLLLSSLLNVALNAFLIPVWGIYGAAGASIFSYGLCGILFLGIYARISNQKLLSLFLVKRNDAILLFGGRKNDSKRKR